MPDELFSIGEVSEIMGISVQTLRYYSNIGLVFPRFIDPLTGYRYYSSDQFHYIDRTRYLLKCGFHLKEIKKILDNNDVQQLAEFLRRKQRETEQEMRQAAERLETLRWYEEYFTYGHQPSDDSTSYYKRHIECRWLLAIQCDENYVHQDFYPLFHELKRKPEFSQLHYKRQFTSVLDYSALLDKKVKRYRTGMYTLEPPGFLSPDLFVIPEGDYWCFKAPILSKNWNPHILKMLIQENGKPKLILSNEYENNLHNYEDCPHEIQILF